MRTTSLWTCVAVALVGCGGKDGGDGPSSTDAPLATGAPGGTPGGTGTDSLIEVLITAAEGGVVEGGGGSLDIPPGALAADTTITLSLSDATGLPDAGSVSGQVFDFGPDGTNFLIPATLTLPLGVTPPTGERAVISWLDGSTWVDLPSTVGTSDVTADVEHFTRFAVRFVPGVVFDCGFAPCGGAMEDITWNLVGVCGDTTDLYAFCPSVVLTSDLSASYGTFVATSATNRFAADLHLRGSVSYDLPASCVNQLPSCDVMDDPMQGLDCSGDPTTSCSCVIGVASDSVSTGDYMINGGDLNTLDDGDTMWSTTTFCVNGNQLKAFTPDNVLLVFETP